MSHAPARPAPSAQRGAGHQRLLAALGIWLALAVIAFVWWKPWERHPNARRAADAAASETAATTAAAPAGPSTPAPSGEAVTPAAEAAPASPTQGAEMAPAELPDARTLLRGSHVKLARVTEGRAEELDSGAVVARGDRLRFGLLLPYRMHVYAFNQEQGAATTVMFPLAALAHRNPLPAGNNELPGLLNGQDASYEVMARGASEEILMVLAIEPNAFLEARIAELGEVATGEAAPPDPAGELSIEALARALEPAVRADEVRVLRWTLRHAP